MDIKHLSFFTKNLIKGGVWKFVILLIFNLGSYLYLFSIYKGLTEYISSLTELQNIISVPDTLIMFFLKILFFDFILIISEYFLKQIIFNRIKEVFDNYIKNFFYFNHSFEDEFTEEKVISVWNYSAKVVDFYNAIILEIPKSFIYLVYYSYIIWNESILLFIILLSVNLIVIFAMNPILNYQIEINDNKNNQDLVIKDLFLDRIRNRKHIILNNKQETEIDKLIIQIDKFREYKDTDLEISYIKTFFNSTLSNVIMIAIYYFNYGLVLSKNLKPIKLLYLSSHASRFYDRIIQIKDFFNSLSKQKKRFELLYKIFNFKKENINSKLDSTLQLDLNESIICYKEMSFNYPNSNKIIFNKFNANIEQNKINVIKGSNGTGKSTLIKLLLGFYPEYTGNIFFENKCLKSFTLKELRDKITLVSQDPYFFNTTINSNLYYGVENKEDIKIEEWIMENLNKKIGRNGNKLSGGEKKKIQIYNALLKNNNIIVLDEPSNNLDEKTVNWLLHVIKEFKGKKTMIIITHDSRLVKLSENLINLNKEKLE